MNFIVRATHWQIFRLLAGINLLSWLVDVLSKTGSINPVLSAVFHIITVCIDIGWMLILGMLLESKQHGNVRNTEYNVFLALGVFYIFLTVLYKLSHFVMTVKDNMFASIVFVLILLVLMFLLSRFVAKKLVSIELGREAVFSEYWMDIVYLIFWPIGIWSIQLRLNMIFGSIDPAHNQKDKF